MSQHSHHDVDPDTDPTAFWEELYGARDRIWSGRPNRALVDAVQSLPRGSALDLGSGEGGDALWLAESGWTVTALDISPTALARAAEHAAERGVPADRIRWQRADLAEWRPTEAFDLVSACFLHSPVAFPREEVLRRAASAVAPGGHLLVVGHAAFPSWADMPEEERPHLPTAGEVLESLALPPAEWTVLVSESRAREATSPDGDPITLDDAVLLVRRSA